MRMRPARRLWHLLLRRPWVLAALVAWQALVLVALLIRDAALPAACPAVRTCEEILLASALVACGLAALVVCHFYLTVREVRNRLFAGEVEAAYEAARRHAGIALGIDLESALRRLLEFEARRAERVATTTRLVGRILRETPLKMFIADISAGHIRFSSSLCELFGMTDNRFDLDALLLLPDNEPLARLWRVVAEGERSAAEDTVQLHLPARRLSRTVHLRLLGVQDDRGKTAYVLGLVLEPEGDKPSEPAEEQS